MGGGGGGQRRRDGPNRPPATRPMRSRGRTGIGHVDDVDIQEKARQLILINC